MCFHLYIAKINETDTFGPGDDDEIQFDDIGDDDEDIDDVSNQKDFILKLTCLFQRECIFIIFILSFVISYLGEQKLSSRDIVKIL